MLSSLLSSASVVREYVSLVDIVAYRRPTANRVFDQIYMMTGDMLTQVNVMQDYLTDKDVIFLGDVWTIFSQKYNQFTQKYMCFGFR